MDSNDVAIAAGGISAPLWLPAMNEWVALVVGILSIIFILWKMFNLYKDK